MSKINEVEKIKKAFHRACQLRDPIACNLLSQFYMKGFPIEGKPQSEQDLVNARKYSLEACDLGAAKACHNLSVMYKYGDGGEKNEEKMKFYQQRFEELTKGSFSMQFGK